MDVKKIGASGVLVGAITLSLFAVGSGITDADANVPNSPGMWKVDEGDDWDGGEGPDWRGWDGPGWNNGACVWVPPAVSMWVPPAVC